MMQLGPGGAVRGRAGPGGAVLYPLMFIGLTHQLMNISRLAYVVAVAPCVRTSV
jgi:hypothetical protein